MYCGLPETRSSMAQGRPCGTPILIPFASMSSEHVPFAERYATLSNEELLTLAQGYDTLKDDAQAALRAEFAHRKMEPPLLDGDEPAVSQRSLVTLRQYRDLSEAIVARSMLETAGITVFLRDENLVRLDWQVSNFIGGIRLQVDQADAEEAKELLNQPVTETIELDDDAEFDQPHCPHCGSLEITFEGANRGPAIVSLFVLNLPVPSGRETWLCSNCGTRWEDTEDEA